MRPSAALPTAPLIDARGLRCPLPVRLLARELERVAPGSEIELVGDDPLMPLDVEAFCHQHGHQASLLERVGALARYRVRRGAQ